LQLPIDKPEFKDIDWQSIAQGSSNRIYKGTKAGQHFILRLNADTDFAFGVDRSREARVLELIKEQSWAPKIVENNLNHDWCLMRYHGEAPQFNESNKTALLAIVKQLQAFSAPVDPFMISSAYFDHSKLFASYIQFFDQRTNARIIDDQPIKLCELLIKHLQCLPETSQVLMHQDLHPGNICLEVDDQGGEGQLKLIDWEYSGWGTPWLDVAALNSYFGISAIQLSKLPSFAHLSKSNFKQGLEKALLFNSGIACVWYYLRLLLTLQREEIQPLEFEYSKRDMDEQIKGLLNQLSM
jgi:thiamine kinase